MLYTKRINVEDITSDSILQHEIKGYQDCKPSDFCAACKFKCFNKSIFIVITVKAIEIQIKLITYYLLLFSGGFFIILENLKNGPKFINKFTACILLQPKNVIEIY